MKWLALLFLMPSAAALAGAANAEDAGKTQPWYFSASGSLSLLNSTVGTIANAPTPGQTVVTDNSFKPGVGVQFAVGRNLGPARLEAEFGYSHNSQDRYVSIVPPTGDIPAHVTDQAFRGMLNGYFDFSHGAIQPYVGAGVGVARINVNFFAPRAPFPTEPPRQLIKDGDTRFAYQLMAGAAVPMGRRLAVTLEYRWFDAGVVNGHDTRGQDFTRKERGHNVDLGIRVRF